jgi:hypothetical protein
MPLAMYGRARASVLLVAVCGLWACSSGERQPARVQPVELPVVSAPDVPAKSPVEVAVPAAAASSEGATDRDKLTLEDEVPLCVFADHNARADAPFLKDVRKQTLRADARAVFGAFAPGCISEACDFVPTLQCWVDREEPNTLVVHSRFYFEHKRGTVCTKDCSPVGAGCETEVLKAGTYSVKYGAREFSLRVPSVMRAPCFKLD